MIDFAGILVWRINWNWWFVHCRYGQKVVITSENLVTRSMQQLDWTVSRHVYCLLYKIRIVYFCKQLTFCYIVSQYLIWILKNLKHN